MAKLKHHFDVKANSNVVVTVRRRKTQSFNRHLEAAEDYIANAANGSFPVRSNISQVRVLQ
jgi:hypothetical protein